MSRACRVRNRRDSREICVPQSTEVIVGRSSTKICATSSSEVMLVQVVFFISEIRHCSDDAASPRRYQLRLSSLAGILISPLLSCIFFFHSPCYVPVNSAAFKSRSSPSFYLSRERAGQEKPAIVSASRYRLVYNNKNSMQCHSGIWPLPPISAANTHSTVAGWRPPAGRPRMFIARPELMSG